MSKSSRSMLCCVVAVLVTAVVIPRAGATTAPTLSSPSAGESFCARSGYDLTVTGSGDPAHDVQLIRNDAGVGSTTPAQDGTFAFGQDLAPGTYTFAAQQDDGSGPGVSASVTVSVFGADGSIAPFARPTWATISPTNHDRYHDTTALSIHTLKSGTVVYRVYRGTTAVRNSSALTGSDPVWTWDGRGSSTYNDGAIVPDGDYTVKAFWSKTGDAGCAFQRSTIVRVDNTQPSVPSTSASPTTFYPRTDDALLHYKDAVAFSYGKPTEKTYVQLLIQHSGSSTPAVTITKGWTTSAGSVTWNGRHRDGSLFTAGTYYFHFKLTDAEKHVKYTALHPITLSLKHVVSKFVSMRQNANQATSELAAGCGVSSAAESDWGSGLWLAVPDCGDDGVNPDALLESYSYWLPSSVYYKSLTFKAYGYSMHGNPLVGFLHNYKQNDDDAIGYVHASSPSAGTFGTVSGSSYVSSGRHVVPQLFLFSACDCADVEYDVAWVQLDVVYGVLAN